MILVYIEKFMDNLNCNHQDQSHPKVNLQKRIVINGKVQRQKIKNTLIVLISITLMKNPIKEIIIAFQLTNNFQGILILLIIRKIILNKKHIRESVRETAKYKQEIRN